MRSTKSEQASVPTGRRLSQGNKARPSLRAAGEPQRQPDSKRRDGRDQEKDALLQHKLSFIDCSIAQIRDGIVKEYPDWQFNSFFWHTILTGSPADDFKPLQNRTLQFWVGLYNTWMEKGFPDTFDGNDLGDLLCVPKVKLVKIIQLLDPEGHKRIRADGAMNNSNLAKVKVEAREIIIAGVMLSKLISTKMKLRFTFGVVDADDDRALDEPQFKSWIHAFIQGLGAVFGVAQDAKVMPTDGSIDLIAERLYKRISSISGRRLKDLHQHGSAETQERILEAVRMRSPTAATAPKIGDGLLNASKVGHRQVLNFHTLQDWCFRVFKDPLALPYALAIERFCSDRFTNDDDANAIDDGLSDWYLSHTTPVPVPDDSGKSVPSQMLTRAEVVTLRSIFQYCSLHGTFMMSLRDIEEGIGVDIEQKLWERVGPALAKVSTDRFDRVKPEFLSFLRCLCPGAQAVHLRMFEVWCQQFDELAEYQSVAMQSENVVSTFTTNDEKAVLPADEEARLRRDFKRIDKSGRGHITIDELADGLHIELSMLKEMLRSHDLSEDSYLDEQDYFTLVCPSGFRLPGMSGVDRELFGKLLLFETKRAQDDVDRRRSLFTDKRELSKENIVAPVPASLLPEVEAEVWTRWNDLFSRLDESGNDQLSMSELLSSGLLSKEVCTFLVGMLEGASGNGFFTRNTFLSALLEVHECRRAGFFA